MRVYLVMQPADGDWDHSPTLLGVYVSREDAEQRRAAYPHGYGPRGPHSHIIEVESGADLTLALH